MTCKVVRVTHTGVTVSDLERTSAFFRDVMGFTVTEPVQHSGDYVSRLHGVSAHAPSQLNL